MNKKQFTFELQIGNLMCDVEGKCHEGEFSYEVTYWEYRDGEWVEMYTESHKTLKQAMTDANIFLANADFQYKFSECVTLELP